MEVHTLGVVEPSGTVSLSADKTIVRISYPAREPAFRALPIDDEQPSAKPVQCAETQDFKDVVSLGADAPRVVLATFTLGRNEAPSEEVRRLVAQGVPYTTGLGDKTGEDQLEAVFLCSLARRAGTETFLGFIDIAEKPPLGPDENVVAVLDLLGFSEIVKTNSIDELMAKFTNGLFSTLSFLEMYSGGVLLFDEKSKGDMGFPPDIARGAYALISDTVVLYLRQKTDQPLRVMCEAVSLFLASALQMRWLFRGAIDIGSFRAVEKSSLFLGRALVEAHELEIAQNWSGCILSHNEVTRFPDEVAELSRRGLLVDYEVPFKAETCISRRIAKAINWTHFALGDDSNRRSWLEAELTSAPERAAPKVEATLSFLDAMAAQGLAAAEPITMTWFNIPIPKKRAKRHRDAG